jgi:sortase B
MKASKGIAAVKTADSILNNTILLIIFLLLAFAGYALWDSKQVSDAADKSHYEVYKPTAENEGLSFKELQAINEEVIAWLSVYGTDIDYPVAQGDTNMKYVNTNAEGKYSLSGAIFLDKDNSPHFSDFNSILYGHHMDKKKMFGEIGNFSNKGYFDSHRYGNLYFDGEDHGIEFFVYIHTDAYNLAVFTAPVKDERRAEYLEMILEKAVHKRDVPVCETDRIVLLSTCSVESTNGRDILIGKLSDDVFADTFLNTGTTGWNEDEQDAKESAYQLAKRFAVFAVVISVVLIVLISLDARIEKKKYEVSIRMRQESRRL